MRQGRGPSAIRRTAPCLASSESERANRWSNWRASRPRMRKFITSLHRYSRKQDDWSEAFGPPDFWVEHDVVFWHLADIKPGRIHVRFRGVRRTSRLERRMSANDPKRTCLPT